MTPVKTEKSPPQEPLYSTEPYCHILCADIKDDVGKEEAAG